MIDWRQPVTLVEGPHDAIVAGENSIPILGSAVGPRSLLLERLVEHQTPVFVALDEDAQGKQRKLEQMLVKLGVRTFSVKIRGGDVDDIGRDKFLEAKRQATPVTLDSSYEDMLLEYLQ